VRKGELEWVENATINAILAYKQIRLINLQFCFENFEKALRSLLALYPEHRGARRGRCRRELAFNNAMGIHGVGLHVLACTLWADMSWSQIVDMHLVCVHVLACTALKG
jgi:hypothetical protein